MKAIYSILVLGILTSLIYDVSAQEQHGHSESTESVTPISTRRTSKDDGSLVIGVTPKVVRINKQQEDQTLFIEIQGPYAQNGGAKLKDSAKQEALTLARNKATLECQAKGFDIFKEKSVSFIALIVHHEVSLDNARVDSVQAVVSGDCVFLNLPPLPDAVEAGRRITRAGQCLQNIKLPSSRKNHESDWDTSSGTVMPDGRVFFLASRTDLHVFNRFKSTGVQLKGIFIDRDTCNSMISDKNLRNIYGAEEFTVLKVELNENRTAVDVTIQFIKNGTTHTKVITF